jgi:ABC-type amino acid transport substrate-binding protein
MLRSSWLALPCVLVLVASFATNADLLAADDSNEPTLFGAGAGKLEPTPIAKIVADPESFEGREVAVRGKVAGVCPMKGCWMELEQDGARVRVKVEDDVIVFPGDAEGRTAVAQGKVELLDMDRPAYVAWRRHRAEELGQAFDEADIGDGPFRVVQIAGSGAEISG